MKILPRLDLTGGGNPESRLSEVRANAARAEPAWRAVAQIDLQSLHHNIGMVRSLAPRSKILAVVKADGYGHGLKSIADAIHQWVDGFAVATLEEGVSCRQSRKNKPVVVLSEFWHESQLREFERHRMQPVIHNLSQLRWLQSYSGKPLEVWIKFDTGMNRLGIHPSQLYGACTGLSAHKSIKQIRIISHLANAEIPGDDYTYKQLKLFQQASSSLRCEKSLANSAGVMSHPRAHLDWVRPGLMLYGACPFPNWAQSELRPVMQLKARLISVKEIGPGQPVGYGGVYRTAKKSTIALVGFGYGDGYPRSIDSRASVLIRGKRARIIGRISMDIITVDVSAHEQVEIGDEVTLWGHGLPVEEVAEWADTIPYELLCKVTTRIPRVVVNG